MSYTIIKDKLLIKNEIKIRLNIKLKKIYDIKSQK